MLRCTHGKQAGTRTLFFCPSYAYLLLPSPNHYASLNHFSK